MPRICVYVVCMCLPVDLALRCTNAAAVFTRVFVLRSFDRHLLVCDSRLFGSVKRFALTAVLVDACKQRALVSLVLGFLFHCSGSRPGSSLGLNHVVAAFQLLFSMLTLLGFLVLLLLG